MEKEVKKYICVCGREFDNPQAFNGHKSHCKVHQEFKYGNLTYLNTVQVARLETLQKTIATKQETLQKEKESIQEKDLQLWISEKHTCEKCGKVMTEKYGSGRFCSRSCANSHQKSEESKIKVSKSLKNASEKRSNFLSRRNHAILNKYFNNPSFCQNCGKVLSYEMRNRSACCEACLKELQIKNGLKSAEVQANSRRSKNEIAFYNMCKDYFEDVEHNKQIFNGWDADVIIHDIKYAILWNGIWYYKQICKTQSLNQIQSRDMFKLQQIEKCGYTPYIIKDLGIYDLNFVQVEFDNFIKYLKDLNII